MNSKEKEEFLKQEMKDTIEKTASANAIRQNPYPSPFLNLSDMHIPETTIEIFEWCKYYYLFDPLIAGAINALATFPVTELHLEDETKESDEDVKLYEKVLFGDLNIYKLLVEIGIDYFLYGNCFVMGEMSKDEKENKKWSNITRLDPSRITIDYNPSTGEKTYKWDIPNRIKKIVRQQQPKKEYDKIPEIIKRAVLGKKHIVLNNESVYHFNRATDSLGDNSVWGVPIVANVLKLLMYRNTLRQAQEAIAREHIVPLRVFYLDRTAGVNINADWNKVAKDLAKEITKTVADPNYKVVSPVPVNMINAGGQGRSLLLTPEIDQVQSEILAGMNVPKEFIFGGVSYSGSSISLRILENQFITYRLLLKDFLQNFIIKGMAKARGEWHSEEDDENLVSVKFTDLKMQDDVQQKQLLIQLNNAGKCSNDYLWKNMGMDPEKMKESIKAEALEAVDLENEVKIKKMKSELESMDIQLQIQKKQIQMQQELAKMQQELQMQGQPQENSEGIPQEAAGDISQQQGETPQQETSNSEAQGQNELTDKEIADVALKLSKADPKTRQEFLGKLPLQYRQRIIEKLSEFDSAKEVDMRPLPQQKPPRRQGGV